MGELLLDAKIIFNILKTENEEDLYPST